MSRPNVTPYGSWKSPITAELLVSDSVGLAEIQLHGNDVYWIERRPNEGGRCAIVRRDSRGTIHDMTPAPFSARTRVHEMGGGAYCIADGDLYFSNDEDQRVYRQILEQGGLEHSRPDSEPYPVTATGALRYADAIFDRGRDGIVCVCEDHGGDGEAVNTLVSLSADGRLQTLASGYDFYSSPRISPDGSSLAWLAWKHPDMPWDATELWIAAFDEIGGIGNARHVAGSSHESVFQPEWSPDGSLYFISDASGWWNLYRYRNGTVSQVVDMDAEFGQPQWVFGMSTYAFESNRRIVCSYTRDGVSHLATVDTDSGRLEPIETPYTSFDYVRAQAGRAVCIAASSSELAAIVSVDLETGTCQVLQRSSEFTMDSDYLSPPEAITFPTANGNTAHGLFYVPRNRDCKPLEDERPPLLVLSHGGPTGSTGGTLSLGVQYWTSRGIAVLDVNYGGSTGYGRAYHERLYGQWGVVDVDDCVNGALFLKERGDVDGARLAIRGRSAGGYTTLAALCFRDIFKAGASYYGISDLEALTADTHKFESRYTDRLVGPYPQCREIYRARSPIHFVDQLSCPVIFFQGLEDKIVPPNQAQIMVDALRRKGLPVAYLPFEGEQHGFRQAQTITRSLEAEFYFYSRVFGFEPADKIEPVAIENL